MSKANKIGFIANSLRPRTNFTIRISGANQQDLFDELNSIQHEEWENDKIMKGEEDERFMKKSRQLFLRKKEIEKYHYNRFITYVAKNYETIREASRQKAITQAKNLAQVENPNEWLGY